jgi:glycosyltransferase involved in cell wall biosynthesis
VIIPTWNRSEHVRNCIRSLRGCGVPDLEILVADDGSTDETAAVVAAVDPATRYLWAPNSGSPAGPRNRAFAESSGRYVAFLDCDDEWLPDAPGRAVELLDRYPQVDVLFAEAHMGNTTDGYTSWIEMGGQAEFFKLACAQPESDFRILELVPFFRRMAVRNPVFIGAVIMRREAFARAGGFDVALRGAADWELWLRMASTMTFGYLATPLAIYRRHDDNMSSDEDGMGAEFCMALQKVREKCSWLAPAERDWVEHRLRHHLFNQAYRAYCRGDYREARRRFGTVLAEGGAGLRGKLYWLACCLPFGLPGVLRGMKHALLGKGTPTSTPVPQNEGKLAQREVLQPMEAQ